MSTQTPQVTTVGKYAPPTEIFDVILSPETTTLPLEPGSEFETHFKRMQHFSYIIGVDGEHMNEQLYFHVTDYLKMSALYWALMALYLSGGKHLAKKDELLSFIMQCYDETSGGFRGNINHDVHLLYTLSAVQILAIFGELDRVDKLKLYQYVASHQRRDGSFVGDVWGEVDTRFSYAAILIIAIFGDLPTINEIVEFHTNFIISQTTDANELTKKAEATKIIARMAEKCPLLEQIDFYSAIHYVLTCRNFDGGFGAVCGGESHSGQIFCSLAFLCLLQVIPYTKTAPNGLASTISNSNNADPQANVLGWWLCERQLANGGLNGRPEKKEDVCYSWWVLTCLTILKKIDWIDKSKLSAFILSCQDQLYGGISDRADTMTDIYHTYFGIAGLSLLQQPGLECVDPVYALPLATVNNILSQKK